MIYNGKNLMLQGVMLSDDQPCRKCDLRNEIQCFEITGKPCQDEDGNCFDFVSEDSAELSGCTKTDDMHEVVTNE